MEKNIQKIQELYKDEEKRKEERKIKDEEVILIKLYEVTIATLLLMSQTSFITEEVDNLNKYMKFVQTLLQTRIFQPLPHYQLLKFRGEQDPTL